MSDQRGYPKDRVAALIADAIDNSRRSRPRRTQRHPADVTADRLVSDYERWFDKLSGREKDDFGTVIQVLREIAGGER